MYEPRYLPRQYTLCLRPALPCSVLLRQDINGLDRQKGKVLEECVNVGIRRAQPELIERIGRCLSGVEPDCAGLSLTKLSAIGFSDQRQGQTLNRCTVHSPGEINPSGYIAPLV